MPGSSHRRAAIAFDIDGVFKYGREWAEAGLSSLRKASEAKIPYVFVTNGGGGLTEKVYGAHLKEKVLAAGGGSSGDIELPSAERMILSYTPWETQLVPGLVDKRVLLVGDPADKVKDVAATYGLKHAVHYSDYARAHPSINPFALARESGTSHTAVANTTVVKAAAQPASKDNAEEPFAAILVMCDPYEWYEALQISIDVLCSPTPLSLEFDPNAAPMPIHFSNPDFLSKFEHPFPRFAQVRARAARVQRACSARAACGARAACVRAACVRAVCVRPVCSLRSACCIWAAHPGAQAHRRTGAWAPLRRMHARPLRARCMMGAGLHPADGCPGCTLRRRMQHAGVERAPGGVPETLRALQRAHAGSARATIRAGPPVRLVAQGAFKVALMALYKVRVRVRGRVRVRVSDPNPNPNPNLTKARLRALRVPEEGISERIGSSLRQWGKPTASTT